MNVLSYSGIINSISSLRLKQEIEKIYPLEGNKWIGINDEPETTIEKYIQDSFDFYLKDKYHLWHNENPWNLLEEPIGFEWWIQHNEHHNTVTFHSNHDDQYRRKFAGVMRYPLLSTETYLTDHREPTIILDTKHGDYWDEFVNFPPTEVTFSIPSEGKFLISDPRYIRGAFFLPPNTISLCYDVWTYKPENLNRVGIPTHKFDCNFYKESDSPPTQWLGKTGRSTMNLFDKDFRLKYITNYSGTGTWTVTQ